MADAYTKIETVNNAGTTVATFGANALKNVINQADVGRELIVKIVGNAGMVDAELNAAISRITRSQGSAGAGDSAFTVAAIGTADGTAFVSGTTTTVFLRCQGTGDLTTAAVVTAAEAAAGGGATTFTVTIEAIFTPAK
jgi:hypothetical protein